MKKVKEDGTTVYVSEDGREYKSKSGAWKRNQKLKSESAGLSSDEVTKESKHAKVQTGTRLLPSHQKKSIGLTWTLGMPLLSKSFQLH